MEKIEIALTKSGKPAIWESGGGRSNTGDAFIITGPNGEPLRPYYVSKRGHLSNGYHALVPAVVGGYIIDANHHRGDFIITIHRIEQIEGKHALITKVNEFSHGEWETELSEKLAAAVEAAKRKATTYHCRTPFYVAD